MIYEVIVSIILVYILAFRVIVIKNLEQYKGTIFVYKYLNLRIAKLSKYQL